MAAEQLQALHATARHDEAVAARATPSISAKNVAAGRKALEAQRLNVDQLLKQRVAIMKTRRPHDDQRCRRRVEDAYVLTADTRSCSFQAMASWFCDGLLAVQALKDDADLLLSRGTCDASLRECPGRCLCCPDSAHACRSSSPSSGLR
jgi:hypothetical protein